ncbi:MAG: APC family permease [Gammaproteobacteria bacterium]|nr:APC family permease [Gammaproteobacteria bacterium]
MDIGFRKSLLRRDVIALAFGAMIGWSWVLLTGEWILRAGAMGAAVAFLVGSVVVLLISLTYAELAAAMPKAGGEHVYALRALGYGPAFVASWAILMAYVTVCVFESAALPTALEYLFPDFRLLYLWSVQGEDVYLSMVLVGVAGSCLMTFINYIGIRFAAFLQTLVTLSFFLVGVSFIFGVFTYESSFDGPLFVEGGVGVLGVLVMVPALLVGFDVIPQSAEEIKLEPALIGKLLVWSVFLAGLWYVGITLAVAWALDSSTLVTTNMATGDAMAEVWGSQVMGNIMLVAGIGGILTSWNAFVIGGSRVLYALAESRMIPAVFAKLHPRYNTPYISILLIGLLSCVSPLFGRTVLVWLVDAGSFAVVIAYIMVTWSFLRLRRSEPDMPRPFRVRYGKWVGRAALLLSCALFCLYLPGSPAALLWPYEWVMVLAGSMIGLAFYLWNRKAGVDALAGSTSGVSEDSS